MRDNDFGHYWQIIRRRSWMILLLFAVTMTVILVRALTTKPVYSAGVRLQVIPMESEQITLYSPLKTTSTDVIDEIGYQFVQAVANGSTAWRTIAALNLNMDADQFLRRLQTARDGEFVSVVMQADSPQQAEAAVTAQVDNALTAVRANRSRPAVVTGDFVAQQLAEAEQALAAAQADLQRFKLSHSIDSLGRETLAYQDQLREMRKAQENASLQEVQLTAKMKALEAEAGTTEAAAKAVPTPTGSEERATLNRRAADLRSSVASLRGEIAGQQALRTEYEQSIARWETELTSLIGLIEEHDRLTNAVNQAQHTRDFLFDKSLEARLKQEQAQNVGYLKVIEPARRPDQPLPTRTLQTALVGGLLSLVAGVILVFLFEFLESFAGGSRPQPREP